MAALGGFLFPRRPAGLLHRVTSSPGCTCFLEQMQDRRISFTIAPPALLNQLAKTPPMWNSFDFSALRCVELRLCAAGAMDDSNLQPRFRQKW